MTDQSARGLYALQQIQSPSYKAGLDVRADVLEAEKLIAQESATIPEKRILSSAFTVRCDVSELKKEALLTEVNKLKDEPLS